ncbi:Nodal modulator 2 [Temnothorax longispinosus]|uniref:Nodal modulator 2 n=1 Tax=Temnothorax longispinosus TaxID=300112 RepID=A0A4S2KVW8_9HYME|nr:Nodal modulator 2 [Temnothorax longispinosus]
MTSPPAAAGEAGLVGAGRGRRRGSILAMTSGMDLTRRGFVLLACLAACLPALVAGALAQDILGCGGFLKSHADIDFTKVHVRLYTKTGSLKDQTECAPNTGYYFLPLYDKGEYVLKVDPPRGWSFEPTEVTLNVDGVTDDCSQGKDINFTFKGFGITGRVISLGTDSGPKGVTIDLGYADAINNNEQVAIKSTLTAEGGTFYFTPIQPGKYILAAHHSKWILKENKVEVIVREGNTELADGSLVVLGYDVSGKVTSENEPVAGVSFILFGNGVAEKCETTPVDKNFESKKPLCHVTSDNTGRFIFPSLSPGDYKLVPHYAGAQTKFDVQPPELSFKVGHGSVVLAQDFKVTGFTVGGLVLISTNGNPLSGAKIFLSQKEVAVTDKDGKYVLDNMKAGQYTLRAESANVQFSERTVKISPTSPELPVLIPSAYKVSGKVTLSAKGTLHFRRISIQNTAATFYKELDTDEKTGEYSVYLAPDKYQLSVVVSTEEKTKGLQFYPLQQTIDVTSQPITNVNFLQLKATLTGTVHCLSGTDCSQASVTLKILDGVTIKTLESYLDFKQIKVPCIPICYCSNARLIRYDTTVPVCEVVFHYVDGQYQFTDVLPGHYEIFIDNDVFCWENPSYRISITSERAEVPPFKQTGFSITFISSHDTAVEYFEPNNTKLITLPLNKGSMRHCVPKSGAYTFVPKGCHVYENSSYTWDTSNLSPILLHSTEHTHKGSIISLSVQNDLKVKIEDANDSVTIGPLKPVKKDDVYKYEFEFKAKTDNMYTITPLSDILLFNPPSLKIFGVNDCHNDIASFAGDLGKIIAGQISPPLEGVTIRITGKGEESPIHTLVTQKDGTYSVGPLDGKIEYSVTAEKEGFVITGPDAKGVFLAHKLAEIIVQVSDHADGSSLQGVLLSLSGGQSYRKNSITNEDGKFIFNSLSPGEYYLRPMMKEYRFDPPSKMINVMEGATVNVNLFGNRVAYSAYGSVTSLNGEPEVGLLVEVQGQGNCSSLQEEATTEENGNFRIRGLQPTCTYTFRLKPNVESNAHIQRTSPSSQLVQPVEDIRGLRLIAFHPISRTDVSVHVTSAQPEHYRTIKVKLCREDAPDSPVHVSKLDVQQTASKNAGSYNAGFLVHFPPLQADGRKYFVQLESSLSQTVHKYRTIPVYFEANSSFKYVKLAFNAERKVDQNEMNQTSVIALPFIMLVALAFLNREKLWVWLNALLERRSKPVPSSRAPVQAIPIDPRADDIIVEQIMNINKRKTKPRKA